MATSDPGRSPKPQRQSPGSARAGHGGPSDPTNQAGQTPDEIFGFHQVYSTGLSGSSGAHGTPADVTVQPGQLDEGLSGVTGSEITSTGLSGAAGGSPAGGGESVRFTDPFAYMGYGGGGAESTAPNAIGGPSDSTKAIDGFAPGPTLPVLENSRPVETGLGQGHTHARHPNAGA